MGKFLNKSRILGNKIGYQADKIARKIQDKEISYDDGRIRSKNKETIGEGMYDYSEEDYGEGYSSEEERYDIGIQHAQKPESFHHFILENQYKDLERSIRGFKDVFDKTKQEWITLRKSEHCFTDEEAEEILRTAQSHLATDIKLSFINKEVIGEMMMAIYKQLDYLFYSISEYRYGRYSYDKEGKLLVNAIDKQYKMKLQNRKVFLELWTRVQANYSRAIQGAENKATHSSVQGQESLQQSGQFEEGRIGRQF